MGAPAGSVGCIFRLGYLTIVNAGHDGMELNFLLAGAMTKIGTDP